MIPIYQLGAINLNDQVNYFVDAAGADFGATQTTWTEVVDYAGGANQQVNVIRSGLVTCTIPMWVESDSGHDLSVLLQDLWVEVDKPTNTLSAFMDNPSTATNVFTIVYSTRPASIVRDAGYVLAYRAEFVLVLMRQPG